MPPLGHTVLGTIAPPLLLGLNCVKVLTMPLRNRAMCAKCWDIIESLYGHDFKMCSCGAIFVDGGNKPYPLGCWRRGGEREDFIEVPEDEP